MDIRRDIIADFKQWKDEIIPIEVKAENCISGRSLSVYNDKYHPLHTLPLRATSRIRSRASARRLLMWRY